MKRPATPMMILLLCMWSNALAAEHEQIALNGDWDFTYTGASTAAIPGLPSALAYDAKITVPGHWDDQLERFKQSKWWPHAVFQTSLGPVQYLSGIGWHRKTIEAPKSWAGRSVVLTVGGAVGTTHVWLNGKHLGMNQLGVYTPYQVDLTRELKPGADNELIVAVDNATANIYGGWALMGNSGMASGLARPVTLDVTAGPGRIADVYIKPGDDLKEVVWEADLLRPENQQAAPASSLEWTVYDPQSDHELGRGKLDVPMFSKSHHATWKARIADIKPWSDREPNLYRTRLRWISADGSSLDSCDQRFGLRRWSYQGRKLFLNGSPQFLRLEFGAYYFPIDGVVSVSKEYWLAHMKRLKELGLNGINFAAQVCPIEMMEAADELGVILQCGDQVTRDEGKASYREVWDSIVRTTRQHPSMSIYGFGGELKYYEGVIEHNKAQMDLIKSLNPESLVMPQQAIHGIDYGIEDPNAAGVEKAPFLHHAERLARYTQACDLFGHYSGGAFSHGYFSTPWPVMEERFKVYQKPVVAHELFISASYLNPENIKKYTGRIPPYIYTRLENDLKDAGMLDKWPVYFDHTSRLQHICRKYCLEKARKCDGLAGFELLGMMDMHFITPEYAVGMVDEFLAMKPGDTLEGIRRYNDESVLLLDFDKGESINRCYWEGEPFKANIMASLYGPMPLRRGTLTWRLSQQGKTLREGSDDIIDIANGRVTTLKNLAINWPQVDATARLNLSVELKGSGYSLANDWDFWVFPKHSAPQVVAAADDRLAKVLGKRYSGIKPTARQSAEKLRIVSKVYAIDIEHLENGGDVVLLGTSPFTAYTQWPSFYPAKGYRPFSNGGTIIAEHPIFAGHPNDGWNDWLFFPLMQGANSVLFDGSIAMPFDPIMEIISSAGHVRKQALVFEQRVGKGRLLVATLVFDMKNPSCVTLMDSLLRYVQSDQFQPQHSVDANELLRAASPPADTANELVDPGFEKAGYWMNEGGKFEIDSSAAHTGHKSLKLTITAEGLKANRNFTSGVSTRQIAFREKPRRLKLSAWFKTDVRDNGFFPKVHADFRYEDAHIRSDSFSISLTEPTGNWQYLEKTIDLDGKITTANVYVELAGSAGSVWVDDIYFGEAPAETGLAEKDRAIPTTQPEGATDWRNEKLTREFKSPVVYRIDNNEWIRGSSFSVDREGVHNVSVKQSESDSKPEVQTVRIDLTPPIVTLQIDPLPEQEAGIFTAKGDIRCTIKAADGLSGVKAIEVSTDGKTFKPFTEPFTLTPGRYTIRCRATDRAGNHSSAMTGEWITGSKSDVLEINVLPAGN